MNNQKEINEFTYKGQTLYLSDPDKLIWAKMNREQRRKAYEQQCEAIKSGKYVVVTDESGKRGIMKRADAIVAGFLVKVNYNGKPVFMKKVEAIKKKLL